MGRFGARGGQLRQDKKPSRFRMSLPRSARAMAGRLSWGLADQAVSSLTNLAVAIFVARSLGLVDFGIFTLAWVTYAVFLNISRGLATDPLVVRFSAVSPETWRTAVPCASGTALMVGIVVGTVTVLAGIGIGGVTGGAFVALGMVLPAVLLQDSWRFAFFAAGVGRKALTNDLVWAGALVPAMFLAVQHRSVAAFVLAWGVAGSVAALYGCVQVGTAPRLGANWAWIRAHRDLGARYLLENLTLSGANQLRMYGLGVIVGLAAIGAVRGAQLLLGPIVAILMGLSMVAVPEAARVVRRSPQRLPAFCVALGGARFAVALMWGMAVLLLVPDELGRAALGAVWDPASALVLPVTVAAALGAFASGATAGVRAIGAARRSLRAELLSSTAFLVGGLGGAVLAGALGSCWGVALASALRAAAWWWQLRAGLRDSVTRPCSDGERTATAAAESSEKGLR